MSPNPLKFAVTFDGLGLGLLPANCGIGTTPVEMTVRSASSTTPGHYSVTITELEAPAPGAGPTSTLDSTAEEEPDAGEDDEEQTTTSLEGGGTQSDPPGPSDGGSQDGLSVISTSEELRQALGAGANPLTDALFSPLMIAEILLRSLAEGATAFLVPLLLILLFGAWLIWKTRKERDNEVDPGPSHGGSS